ncbi:MAG TPA: ADYC domain-containing protein [Kofleriaceae bacterium]
MCGTNSPQIAEFGFWELNLPTTLGVAGLPNNVGLQLLEFVQGNQAYLPRVIGGRLIATSAQTTLAGSQLVNGFFLLRNGSRAFKLRVTEVSTVPSWAMQPSTGTYPVLESYKLDWFEFVNGNWGDPRNMCPNPPSRDSSDLLTMGGTNLYRTLLFEGDRIDAARKRDTGVDTTWFNLGCAGSALAKMALTGHTEASRVTGAFNTTLAERQTMLKMLSADYCGDGTPFTVAGQPLNWRDDHGTMKFIAPENQLLLESRWTASGAACLDKPRVDVHPTPLGTSTFAGGVYPQVMALCPQLPQCADASFNNDGYHLLTATAP